MNDYFLKQQIERIEREANNDYTLIQEFGADCYPTFELQQLLGDMDFEIQRYLYYKRTFLILGASTFLWLSFIFLFRNLNYTPGLYISLALLIVSIVSAFVGMIFIKNNFKHINQLNLIESIIKEELARRRKDASIY